MGGRPRGDGVAGVRTGRQEGPWFLKDQRKGFSVSGTQESGGSGSDLNAN